MTIEEAINLGLQRQQAGQLAEAEAIYRQILAQQPNQPEVLHLLGVIAQQARQVGAAMQLIGRAIELSPRRADFHGSMGLTLELAGRIDEAIGEYQLAVELDPRLTQARNNLGNALAVRGRIEEAAVQLRAAMQQRPDFADAPYNLGNLCLRMGRFEEAGECFRRALALRPNWPEAQSNLGLVHRQKGEIDEAIACFGRALAAAPAFLPAVNNLGTTLWQARRFEEAVGMYRQAVAAGPNYPEAHNTLGHALQQIGQHEEAIACFGRATALQGNFPEAQFNLGTSLAALGRMDEAIAAFRQATLLRPDFAEAHNNLGSLWYERLSLPEAIGCFGRAIAVRPDYASAYTNLGLAYKYAGMWEQSAGAFGRVLALRPQDPMAYWSLSDLWKHRKRVERTAAEVSDALPPLPYLGDKVVLLRCDRAARERLRGAGLHGGYAIDPRSGGEPWLMAQFGEGGDAGRLPEQVGRWLEWVRNEAAMAGTTCTVWMPEMTGAAAEIFRAAAGADLIEIAGESAAEIHGRLCERAVAPPLTEGKIFAVVSIRNGGLELLPHWLEHYTKLGVDEMLVGVFNDVAGEGLEAIDECARRWNFRRFVQDWHQAIEEEQYSRRETACREAGARPETWILHTDLDELHQYPAPIHEIIRAAAEKKIGAIHGHFVDRVAADGSLPPVRAEPSVWEQYPIECKLTENILRGGIQKVMLSAFSVRVRPGHHEAVEQQVLRPPIGTAEDYRVAHFKWHGDVLARMRWGLGQEKAAASWKGDVRRFFAWFDRRGGRIDLSDPALEAKRAAR